MAGIVSNVGPVSPGVMIPGGHPSGTRSLGYSGPGNMGVTWMQSGTDMSALQNVARAFNFGRPPTMNDGLMHMSNDFIQHQYTLNVWEDRTFNLIAPGALVFALRDKIDSMDLTTVATLALLNIFQREAYAIYETNTTPGNPYADPEMMEFKRLKELYGEKALEEYAHRYDRGIPQKENEDLRTFMGLARKPVLRYLTRYGILSHWVFLGAALVTTPDVTHDIQDPYDGKDGVLTLNVILGKRARIANLWGTTKAATTGARLYLLLRRRAAAGGTFREYEWVPYVCHEREYPPSAELRARETRSQGFSYSMGYAQFVGTVSQPPDDNSHPARIEHAAGISSEATHQSAYEAHGTLPTLYAEIGM